MVALLLAGGSDANLADGAGTTPLIAASQTAVLSQIGAAEIPRRLAQAGADVNARDRRGQTAATIAADKGNPEMLVLLPAGGRRTPRRTSRGLGSPGVDVLLHAALACANR
jgi:ankyrin repeat protein